MDGIEKRLEEHYSCFCAMVDLIPAKYYLTKDPEAVEQLTTSKYWVNNRKSKTPKQAIKDATKRAKRIKLDPENETSVLCQQKEAFSELVADCGSTDNVSTGADERLPGNGFSVETVKSTEFSDLRERLKVRIESLRSKRKFSEEDPEQIVVKKQKRVEMKKRKKEIQQKKKKNVETESAAVKLRKERPSLKAENGKIVFSKFDFRTAPSVQDVKPGKTKDYRKLLAKAEATEKKLEELKKNDEIRGEELKQKLQWRKALDLAKGAKVKDDPKLLKKSLKRLEQKKAKSHKYWTEKNEQEAAQREKKQEIRKKHIQERIDQIKAKKNKRKLKGKPRTPGF